MYRRFFRIKDAETLAEISRLRKERSQYIDSLNKIKDQVGAKDIYTDSRSGHFSGFGFAVRPDSDLYREPSHKVFYPRKKTKEGKELCKQIEAVPKVETLDTALLKAGVTPGFSGSLMIGLTVYFNTIRGGDSCGWFASIPWYDEDPVTLAEYKLNRESGVVQCGNYDHLLWTPPIEWEEIKEWEVRKALDEAKTNEND